jgi:uncharacterized protein (DUF362 family)/NAD-dependent dihydropyrimidine dehydrogenase PreA subunit
MSRESGVSAGQVLVLDAAYERMSEAVEQVIAGLGLEGLLSSVRGKKVFIKPNMLGPYGPERHVCTHPSLVREVVRRFRDAGAEVMVGDNPGVSGYGVNERVARKNGIMEASEGCFYNAGAEPRQVPMNSRFFSSMVVSKRMLDADYLISLPKMKTHSLTVLTAAIKNMFGILVGGCKSRVHAAASDPKDFGEALVDIYQVRVPDLHIIDAVVVMEGNGPSAGKLRPAGKLIASRNGLAADMVVSQMMNLEPLRVHHLRRAAERGLGPNSISELELAGEFKPLSRFRLPGTIRSPGFIYSGVNRLFYTPLSRTKLKLDRNRCTNCGICVDHCPTGAMQKGEFPCIDEERCIRCFCCFELCPENAWKIQGLLGRIRGRGSS